MAHRKVLVGMTCFLVVLAGVLGLAMDVMSISEATVEVDKARPDLILIDAMAEKQPLEMPAAVFLHDRHTEALKDKNKDCTACHKEVTTQQGQKALSFSFQRTEDMGADELKALYHDKCISCHTEDKAANAEKYGPQAGECRTCHAESPEYSDAHLQVDMNNVLHYRHWNAESIPKDKGQETNCGNCHHEYDKAVDKLVYIKFEEESCSYCHTANPAESPAAAPKDGVTFDTVEAYHAQCVNCHRDLQAAKVENVGPMQCAGCHGAETQAGVSEENATVLQKLGGTLPRLPRKQPDAALLLPPKSDDENAKAEQESKAGIMPVAFNHLIHEQKTDSCADCHHQSVKACGECHSVTGKEEGDFVTIEEAMHQVDSQKSCIGCHAVEKSEPTCAGCHAAMAVTPEPSESTCRSCHIEVVDAGGAAVQAGSTLSEEAEAQAPEAMAGSDALSVLTLPLPEDKEAKQALAQKIVDLRPDKQMLVAEKDIPEKVSISVLSKKFKPSEMPHRKIVLKLAENIKDNDMATSFHGTEVTLCQGCHHNSPPSATPPSCKSCHGKPFVESRPGRPGLKAAYHGQCMDCHKEMNLEKPASTDCKACHEKRDNG